MKDSTDNNSRNLVDYPESESEDDIIQEESSRSILVKSKEKEINPDPVRNWQIFLLRDLTYLGCENCCT